MRDSRKKKLHCDHGVALLGARFALMFIAHQPNNNSSARHSLDRIPWSLARASAIYNESVFARWEFVKERVYG